jgi:cyclic pyranopterin phosphate synthase
MTTTSKIFNPQSKIVVHSNRVLDYFKGKNVDPINIEIDPSNACNHSCPFCISGHLHLRKFKGTEFFNRQMMNKQVLMNLVKDLSNTNIKSISWTGGGEPTMNPNLKEAINYIKENSEIDMGMFTNGSMLERFDLFNTVVNSLKWIRISMDAGKSQSYDKLRATNKSNNFQVILNNIKKLIEIKKMKKSKITIGVGFVISRDNFKEIIDFANLFKDLDVDYCQYKPEIIQIERNTFDGNDKKQQISAEFWAKEVLNLLDKASKILGKKFQCNSYKVTDLIKDKKLYGREYKKCIGSQFQPCIGADGEVYVCTNHRGHKDRSYGSLYEKSFLEIWSNVTKRKCVMDKIENLEKFSMCSQLCKPHESNKILWQIKNNLDHDEEETISNLKKQSIEIKDKLIHKNFI